MSAAQWLEAHVGSKAVLRELCLLVQTVLSGEYSDLVSTQCSF